MLPQPTSRPEHCTNVQSSARLQALQTIGGQGGNDVTDAVQDLETADDVRGAYDQLSGQTRPPLAPMTIAGSSKFLGTVTSRVQTVKTGLVAGAFDSKLLAAAGPDQALGGSPSRSGQDFAIGHGTRFCPTKPLGFVGARLWSLRRPRQRR